MVYFNNDYSEGCHEQVLRKLMDTNMEQTLGYGEDPYCREAAEKIRRLCGREDLAVHFLVGGTQTNLTVISAALRPHQCVLGAESAHIHTHETGAIEAAGHKVQALPSSDGKITAAQVEQAVLDHREDEAFEHMPQPRMVYISNPTELGTLYSLRELEELSAVCRKLGLYLFLDGARLGYSLTARENDVTMEDLARLCDVFYIGGTKCGAMFGEAVVISSPAISEDFRYIMKQRGAMLAKGRLLGVQFSALLEHDLYFAICRQANILADQLRMTLRELGYPLFVPGSTNQVFAVLPEEVLDQLSREYTFSRMQRVDETHRVVRFCTSWATGRENVDALCADLKRFSGKA